MTNKSIRDYINLIENAQQGVAEDLEDKVVFQGHTIGHIETDSDGDPVGIVYSNNPQSKRPFEIYGYEDVNQLKQEMISQWNKRVPKGMAEGSASQIKPYSGKPEGYTFSRVQQKNYDMLVDILARNGMKFTKIDASTYPGERSYLDRLNKSTPIMLTTFLVKSPALEWHKYEGFTAGGGQNTVKVGGKKMKLTDFLRLAPKQQDALLRGVSEEQLEETSPEAIAKIDQITRR